MLAVSTLKLLILTLQKMAIVNSKQKPLVRRYPAGNMYVNIVLEEAVMVVVESPNSWSLLFVPNLLPSSILFLSLLLSMQATSGYSETILQQNLVGWAPLSICLDAANWQDYTSGVMVNARARSERKRKRRVREIE